MNPNKALWEKGDFTRIAETMRESGEAVVQSLGITPVSRCWTSGCGDGTTAIPEAKLGADVLGVDIARNLVDAGNRRAKAGRACRISPVFTPETANVKPGISNKDRAREIRCSMRVPRFLEGSGRREVETRRFSTLFPPLAWLPAWHPPDEDASIYVYT